MSTPYIGGKFLEIWDAEPAVENDPKLHICMSELLLRMSQVQAERGPVGSAGEFVESASGVFHLDPRERLKWTGKGDSDTMSTRAAKADDAAPLTEHLNTAVAMHPSTFSFPLMALEDYTDLTGRDWRAACTLVGDIATSLERFMNLMASLKWDPSGRANISRSWKNGDDEPCGTYPLGEDSCSGTGYAQYWFPYSTAFEAWLTPKIGIITANLANAPDGSAPAQGDGGPVLQGGFNGLFFKNNNGTSDSHLSSYTSYTFGKSVTENWSDVYDERLGSYATDSVSGHKSIELIVGEHIDRSMDRTHGTFPPVLDFPAFVARASALPITFTPGTGSQGNGTVKGGELTGHVLYDRTQVHEYTGGLA